MGLLKELNRCTTTLEEAGFSRIHICIHVAELPNGVAGRATEPNIIQINSTLKYRHTVVLQHEIAHLYTYKYFPDFVDPHGEEFRNLLDLIS
jgi:hypothetical protein